MTGLYIGIGVAGAMLVTIAAVLFAGHRHAQRQSLRITHRYEDKLP